MAGSSAKKRLAPGGDEAVRLLPLRSPPLKEQVTRELTRLIEDGVLGPGAQLPSERELSEQLQVSRGTVREAVGFLNALGLVEIRHGAGTFVRASPADRDRLGDEWRAWTRRHARRVHELLEVRRGLESFAAELAATRAAEEGLATMQEALEKIRDAVDAHDVPLLVQADVLFHHGVAVASGNTALIELVDALGAQLLQERAATWDIPGRAERSLTEHREIYEAIRGKDARRVRAALLAHLASVERDVDQLISAGPRPATRSPAGGRRAPRRKHRER